MAFRSKKAQMLSSLIIGVWLSCINSSVAETNSTTTTEVAPVGVKKCYKCEGDCNGGLGRVEKCSPDSDSLIFACYSILIDGKVFQRGCTIDFSEGGTDCVTQKGNTYCFCQTDECNNSLGSLLLPTCPGATVLFSTIISVISGNIITAILKT